MPIQHLYRSSRLIAKTINRVLLNPEEINLQDWRAEGKLLASPSGDCLSSGTLLVEGQSVPTYSIDGRCYGLLFDATKCYIYDVNSTDVNSNRDDKLAKRASRRNLDFLHRNEENFKTLDELSEEIIREKSNHLNEILFDGWKHSLVSLFVRKIPLSPHSSKQTISSYYQSLLEIMLVQKYLIQALDYPADLKIYVYEEVRGKLEDFPEHQELIILAKSHGLDQKYPLLFEQLSVKYHFKPLSKPETIRQFLESHERVEEFSFIFDKLVEQLVGHFEPFDHRPVNTQSILDELVDGVLGMSENEINDIIEEEMQKIVNLSTSPDATAMDGFFMEYEYIECRPVEYAYAEKSISYSFAKSRYSKFHHVESKVLFLSESAEEFESQILQWEIPGKK